MKNNSIVAYFNYKTKLHGETILEVVIAIGILSLVLFSAFGLIAQSIATHTNIKNRVTAIDLAREGLEIVRNVRDTNWIKYSGDKRTQWLCYQSPCTAVAHRLSNGFYTVDPLVVQPLLKATEQSLLDVDNVTNYDEYQILDDPALGFNHVSGQSTMFYRQIELQLYTNAACGNDVDDCPEVGVNVISRVQWLEGSRKSQITLQTRLYDFFDRDSY